VVGILLKTYCGNSVSALRLNGALAGTGERWAAPLTQVSVAAERHAAPAVALRASSNDKWTFVALRSKRVAEIAAALQTQWSRDCGQRTSSPQESKSERRRAKRV